MKISFSDRSFSKHVSLCDVFRKLQRCIQSQAGDRPTKTFLITHTRHSEEDEREVGTDASHFHSTLTVSVGLITLLFYCYYKGVRPHRRPCSSGALDTATRVRPFQHYLQMALGVRRNIYIRRKIHPCVMDDMVQCHPRNNKCVPWAALNLEQVQFHLSNPISSVRLCFFTALPL